LSRNLIDALTAAGTDRQLVTGDLLCDEGDDSDEAYVVVSGRLVALAAATLATWSSPNTDPILWSAR